MRYSYLMGILLVGMLVFIVGTGIVAGQDGGSAQAEINNSLTEIETFVATTLGKIGVIVLLVGSAAWLFSSKRSDRAAWGWRAIWGGSGMIILSASYNVIVTLIESFAPGVILLPHL